MITTSQNTPSEAIRSTKTSDPTHDKGIKAFAHQMPKNYRLNYLRAMSGTSRAAAVKAKCLDCCCWQRKEVQLCTASTCPLHPYRPYQKE